MKIILVKDVERLGNAGKILNVKDGYARNYLVPRGFALIANENNVRELEFNRKRIERMIDVEKTAAQDLAEKLSAVDIQIERKVGDEGKLFGSVTNRDIAAVLTEKGFTINSHHIIIESPIKKTGLYQPEVKLFRDVRATLKVLVVSEDGEVAPIVEENQVDDISIETSTEGIDAE